MAPIKHSVERAIRDPIPGLSPAMIQRAGAVDRSPVSCPSSRTSTGRATYTYYRASLSYITGAHAFKFGVGDIFGPQRRAPLGHSTGELPVQQRRAQPDHDARATRSTSASMSNHQFGAYVQDRWTVDRLTLNVGLRYDWFQNSFPAAGHRACAAGADAELPVSRTEGLSLARPEPETERRLRPVWRREDRAEGEPQPLRRTVHGGWYLPAARNPSTGWSQPTTRVVERRESQLRPGLQPADPGSPTASAARSRTGTSGAGRPRPTSTRTC